MDGARILRAAMLAAGAHAGQRRRGVAGAPYVNHVIEVAALVAEAGGTEDDIVAALLHDVVEDTDLDIATLADAFGADVVATVAALTDLPEWQGLSRADRKAAQAERVAREPAHVRRIKMADQTANLRDIARDPEAWDAADAEDYIAGAIGVVAGCRGSSALIETAFDTAVAAAMQKLA